MNNKSTASTSATCVADREIVYADSATTMLQTRYGDEICKVQTSPEMLRDMRRVKTQHLNRARDSWRSLCGELLAKHGSTVDRASQLRLRLRRLVADEPKTSQKRLTDLYPEDILLLQQSRTNLRKEFMWLHHYHHGDTESIAEELETWVDELRQTHEKFTAMYSRFIEHVILQQILQFNSQVTDIMAAVNFVAAAVKSVGRRPSAEHLAKLTSGVDAIILDISEHIKKIPCSATGETSLLPEELLEYGSTALLHVMQQCQALAAKMITMNKRIADKDDADAESSSANNEA
jgi:hypothetical protein